MRHPLLIAEALEIRNISKTEIDNIFTTSSLAKEILEAKNLLFSLKEKKNKLADSFKGRSAEQRELLKIEGTKIKEEIALAEASLTELEKKIFPLEMSIPNIPSSDVPLSRHYSEKEASYKRSILNVLHCLIDMSNDR